MADETLMKLISDHKELWMNLGDFDFANPLHPRNARVDLFHRALVEDGLVGRDDYIAVKQTLNMLGW